MVTFFYEMVLMIEMAHKKKYTDQEIVSMLKSSSKRVEDEALMFLYNQHYRTIQKYVKANSGSDADVDDLFQDAVFIFYEQIRKNTFTLNCGIGTYLFSIGKNLWIKKLRKRGRMVALSEAEKLHTTVENSLDQLIKDEQIQQIANYLDRMGSGCKEILKYYYYDRLKMKEITRIMNFKNEQVAKNKKSRCMRKLKTLLIKQKNLKDISF